MNTSVVIVSGLILALMLMLTGCTGNSPPAGPGQDQVTPVTPDNGILTEFHELDNGKTYDIPRNTDIFILLHDSPAGRYPWNGSASDGLEILDKYYLPNRAGQQPAINGTYVWQIRAAGTGNQSFHAEYFDNDTQKAVGYDLILRVLPESR